jgi:3-methyladenine DNA glycosylase AlkC
MDFQLRNTYNVRVCKLLAIRIKKKYKQFNDKGFIQGIAKEIDALSFGDRSVLIRKNLKKYLPDDPAKAIQIIIDSLGPELVLEPGKTEWDSFINVSLSEFIMDVGMDPENFDLSMKALYELTKRCSSENAIRPFIRKYPKKTFVYLNKWIKDENVHPRRLVSEGTRPRLPLSSPLRDFIKDPTPIIPFLEVLKDDPELYVRRSVANNLNDISKDNPTIVVAVLKKWKKNASANRMWVIRHALRTLLKRGNKDALLLLGYGDAKVELESLKVETPHVGVGEHLCFTAMLHSLADQDLMIDYAIHFVKANGKHRDKVFKLAKKKVKKGEKLILKKRHLVKQMSTRKHYAGEHLLELIVNGKRMGRGNFDVSSFMSR